MTHGQDKGGINLPFTGIATFGKSPYLSLIHISEPTRPY